MLTGENGILNQAIKAQSYTDNKWKIFNENKLQNTNILLTTGASDRNSLVNIYDFAGNVWEWTLEHTNISINPCSRRSSGYKNNGYTHPAANRGAGNTEESMDSIGFRISLY